MCHWNSITSLKVISCLFMNFLQVKSHIQDQFVFGYTVWMWLIQLYNLLYYGKSMNVRIQIVFAHSIFHKTVSPLSLPPSPEAHSLITILFFLTCALNREYRGKTVKRWQPFFCCCDNYYHHEREQWRYWTRTTEEILGTWYNAAAAVFYGTYQHHYYPSPHSTIPHLHVLI